MSYSIFTMRPVTEKVGEIRTNGELYATDGKLMGSISVQGRIRDTKGVLLGIVSRDGNFSSDIFDTKKFKATRKGHIVENGSPIGSVKQNDRGIPEKFAQWAACAFFFYGSYDEVEEEEIINEIEVVEVESLIEPEPISDQAQATFGPEQAFIQTQRLPMLDLIEESKKISDDPILPKTEKLVMPEPAKYHPIDDSLADTNPMPNLESLESYASMRMAAFMEKKMREKEESISLASGD